MTTQHTDPNSYIPGQKILEVEEVHSVADSTIVVEDTTDGYIVEKEEVQEPIVTEEETKPVTQYVRASHNVNVEEVWTGDEGLEKDDIPIPLPGNFEKEITETINSAPKIDYVTGSPEAVKWARTLAGGLQMLTYGEAFVPNLEKEGNEYKQYLNVNDRKIAPRQPKYKSIQNQILKGERATLRVMTHLGLGSQMQVPLYHSGFSITFKPASETELVELDRLLSNDKIKFGRHTYGMVFSNTSVYVNERLIDFALDHIYETDVSGDIDTDQLKSLILCQDIPTLLAGFACTMYPKGFPYSRSCVNNPEKCNYVLESKLNLRNLFWVHRSILTEQQKAHMATWRPGSKTIDSIKEYQKQLARIQPKRVIFNEGREDEMAITLKSPNINDYVQAGHRWITGIVDLVEDALSKDTESRDRNYVIVRHGQATSMRQYAHWIQAIEFDTNSIEDIDTIESNLNVISSDDYIRDKFLESVSDYINQTTFCIVGIPSFDCPKCNGTQESHIKLPYHSNIIPLDVIQVFIALLTQRIERILGR